MLSRFSYTGIACLCLVINSAAANEKLEPLRKQGDWWLGLDAGIGVIDLQLPEGTMNENKFYLGVRAEYVLDPKFLLGIDASGWLIQPGEIEYNTGTPPQNFEQQIEGEGLAPVLLTLRYYPKDESGWYLKAGAGYVSHWKTHLGVTERESGSGVTLGAGYDYPINKHWDITTFVTYSSGNAGDEDYDAVTLALGFNYKIRRK